MKQSHRRRENLGLAGVVRVEAGPLPEPGAGEAVRSLVDAALGVRL